MTTATSTRRKYQFRDRASAEDAYLEANASALRRGLFLAREPDFTVKSEREEDCRAGLYKASAWLRPRSGFIWYAVWFYGNDVPALVRDGNCLEAHERETWNMGETGEQRAYRQMIHDLYRDAHKALLAAI